MMMTDEQSEYDMAALMQEAIECLPDGFGIMDRDFRPLLANRIIREAFSDFFTMMAQGAPHLEAHFAGARRALPDATDEECWRIAKSVSTHIQQGKAIDLTSVNGRTYRAIYKVMNDARYVAVYIDITELRQRKRKLEALRREAEAANQAKSTFLANMSHEIRTPLNGILGMAQVLADDDLEADDREQVEIILESGKTLKALLEDVLDLSKIEAGHMELVPADCDLEQIIRRQYSLWLPRAEEKGIGLTFEIAPGLPKQLRLDPIRFGQCLSNLTSNAIKFTERGEVSVTIASREAPGGFMISVSISDTGIGMSAETAGRLFTPFTQGDTSIARRFGGTGLGLVITRRLALLMGGDVVVSSEAGKGSTFTLTLAAEPASIAPPSEANLAKATAGGDPAQQALLGKRILLVDDHMVNRRVARLFLQPAGYDVTDAENGLEALEKLEEGAFDLILLDIHMPVLDGLETLKRIRAAAMPWSDIPVIALTADAMSGDRERYLAVGMNGYLSKPIDKQDLLAKIARLLTAQRTPNSAKVQQAPLKAQSAEAVLSASQPMSPPDSPPAAAGGFEPKPPLMPERQIWSPETSPNPVPYTLTEYEMATLMQEGIDALPHGFAIFDDELRPIMTNQLSRATFIDYYAGVDKGLSFQEANYTGIRLVMPNASDEECGQAAAAIEAHLRAGKSIDLRTAGGIYRTTYSKMSHDRFVAVSVDVTDERNREKELEAARRQADAANQAKSAFLANMSHEIRTPLNGILGMAQVLAQRALPPAQQEQARAILESGKALKMLLDDVLDLSKIEAGRMELVLADHELRLVLERVRQIWEPQARRKGIAIRLHTDEKVPDVLHFDPTRLEQCVSNLVSNAVKFTESGEVRIELSAQEAPGGIAVTIGVSDTGIGMSGDMAGRLFTPFTQGDNSISRRFGGTGLGLVITRKLAELMGGGVVARSVEGKGSTFTLTLMAEPARMPHGHVRGERRSVSRTAPFEVPRNKRILLVDDHPINRRVGRLFLEPEGYQVTEAKNGLEALERLDESEFDLILLDIHMPVLDGLQTLERIRGADKSRQKLPIIALTADAMSGDRERYLAAGMNGYVAKPIEQRDLLAEIARLLGSRPPKAISQIPVQGAKTKLAPAISLSELDDLFADIETVPRKQAAKSVAAKAAK